MKILKGNSDVSNAYHEFSLVQIADQLSWHKHLSSARFDVSSPGNRMLLSALRLSTHGMRNSATNPWID